MKPEDVVLRKFKSPYRGDVLISVGLVLNLMALIGIVICFVKVSPTATTDMSHPAFYALQLLFPGLFCLFIGKDYNSVRSFLSQNGNNIVSEKINSLNEKIGSQKLYARIFGYLIGLFFSYMWLYSRFL